MPKYQYKCNECKNETSFEMKINEFLQFKKIEHFCEECKSGKIVQIVKPSHSKISRDKESLIQDAREEARKTMEKIRQGDEKTFVDIYGDAPNQLKNRE